jgi:LmbE family N-acetylglucosaminyl deacetylase
MKESTLILAAHLDDFELGMGGTTAKLCTTGDVYLLVLCKGDRPGHESVDSYRRAACVNNCNDIGIKSSFFYNYSDTRLDQVPQTDLCNIIHQHIQIIKPTKVYTHCRDDVHKDHRIVSDATRVACRMRASSPVDKLYEFTIPGSTEWNYMPTQFNVFENITEHASDKMEMISRYCTELRPSPDPISLSMIESRDKYHGSLCGYTRAEIFKLVFSR